MRLMEGEHVGPFNLGNPGEFTMLELAKVCHVFNSIQISFSFLLFSNMILVPVECFRYSMFSSSKKKKKKKMVVCIFD